MLAFQAFSFLPFAGVSGANGARFWCLVMPVAIGIDIGGTNTKVGVVDSRGTILHRLTFPAEDDAAELLAFCACP